MSRYRDSKGRYTTKERYAQELQLGKVKYRYANGRRIRKKRKSDFIRETLQEAERKREEKRSRERAERKKREKITGKTINKPETPPSVINTDTGEIKEPSSEIETYVRYGYTTRRVSGSDGLSGRGAVVLSGEIDIKEALDLTKPESFYRGWYDLGIKQDIQDGELILLSGSGIHYQLQRRFNNNIVKPIKKSVIIAEQYDMLRY